MVVQRWMEGAQVLQRNVTACMINVRIAWSRLLGVSCKQETSFVERPPWLRCVLLTLYSIAVLGVRRRGTVSCVCDVDEEKQSMVGYKMGFVFASPKPRRFCNLQPCCACLSPAVVCRLCVRAFATPTAFFQRITCCGSLDSQDQNSQILLLTLSLHLSSESCMRNRKDLSESF